MSKQKKILIVEDEAINAMFLKILLSNNNYAISGTVATGKEAIASVEENCPDLVLMDITLRDSLNGIETANLLREKYVFPIIFISGYDDSATANEINKISNAWKLTKPIDDVVLTDLLHKIFNDYNE